VNSKLNKRPDAILGVEQETVAHGESCACSSYHVHRTRDGEGTSTVFFTFLPAKGPFVTTHDPFVASSLTVFAVRKVFSTGIFKISVVTDKREYRIYQKFIGDRNKNSEEI
jgi:hypothetical protein